MQKWEYAWIYFNSGTNVISFNGEKIPLKKESQKISTYEYSKEEKYTLVEYLNVLGDEGWEAVGLSKTSSPIAQTFADQVDILFKRPIP